MPDLPTTQLAQDHRARRRAGPPARASLPDVLALVERAARVSDGLALLERAPLECIAVLLGVDPGTIERARAALEDPAIHDEAVRAFQGAAGRRAAADAVAAPARPPRDPEALILAARGRPDGLALLFSASPEAAAIAFGVHPDLVHGARQVAARDDDAGDVEGA